MLCWCLFCSPYKDVHKQQRARFSVSQNVCLLVLFRFIFDAVGISYIRAVKCS